MSEQNISLFIGKTASGKTRILKEKIQEARKMNDAVVTNLPEYKLAYVSDLAKKRLLLDSNNRLVNDIVMKHEVNSLYDAYISSLLDLIYARGDVLVLDDLDSSLMDQDIVFVSMAIADCRKLWKRIFVTGYSDLLIRLFMDVDKEDYTESVNYNLFYVSDSMKIVRVSEGDSCEYFDTIRG